MVHQRGTNGKKEQLVNSEEQREQMSKNQPPEIRPSTLCIAAIRIDQSFSGTRVEVIFSTSRISSFSEYTLIGSMGFSVTSPSAQKLHHQMSPILQSEKNENSNI